MTEINSWIRVSLVLLFACTSVGVFAQCELDAGEDVTICAGESVTLGGSPTVESNNNPTLEWSNGLGDDPNPLVSPLTTTTYTVTLEGEDCDQEDEITVTVLPNPEASFVFSPDGACAGQPVSFNSTSSGIDLDYDWDFGNPQSGNNNSSSQEDPNHTFIAPGNGNQSFVVTLTITDENGCSDSVTQTVDVIESPDASVIDVDVFSPFEICGAQGQTSFDITLNNASSTSATNTNYTIDWGDGSPLFSEDAFNSATHTYNDEGFFDLTVTVEGANGCESIEEYEVFVGSNPSIGLANPGATINLCSPNTLVFPLTNYENNSPGTQYTINFSDGTPPVTFMHPPPASVSHVFDISSCGYTTLGGFPNSFYVQIIAENPCGFSAATIEPIQTSSSPTASMDVFPGTEGCAGVPFTFENTSTNANYNNNGNCTNLMLADWSIDPPTGWTVTGGSLNDPTSFSAVFDPGEYTITMEGSNPCGSDVVTMDICVTTPPTALFTIDPTAGCVPLVVPTENFSSSLNNCDNESYQWVISPASGWYVSDGSLTSVEPEFTFTQQGTYTIQLQVTNLCGTAIYTQQVTVIEPPLVDLTPIPDACEGTSVTPSALYDSGGGTISSYDWAFPGGLPSTSSNPSPGTVNYPDVGNYTVTITIENECGTATDVESFSVEAAPLVTITSTNDELCNGQSAILTASGAVTYVWDPAPGLIEVSGAQATVAPTSTQTYTVTGYSAVGCVGTASITIDVNPLPVVFPDGVFEICAGDCVDLALAVSGGLPPYTTYNWTPAENLDDPSSATPQACPPTSTNYNVTVTDMNGCQGTTIVPVTVNPLPTVNAGPDVTLCDQPVPEQLVGYSPLGGTWSGPNIDADGEFTPDGTGTFTVVYTYIDMNGCVNSDDLNVTVIAPTTADAGPDQAYCQSSLGVQLEPVTPGGSWSGTDVTTTGVFTPSTPGLYTLTYELGVGSCLSSDAIEVEVWELPTAEAGLDVSICAGDSVQLGASVTDGALPYAFEEWAASPFLSDVEVIDPWALPAATSTFTYTVVDANGCSDDDQVTVTVLLAPVVDAGPNLTLCDQPIPEQLTGFSPNAGAGESGEWSGPDVTLGGEFTPSGAGSFTLYYTFTNVAGCSNVDSLVITVVDPTNANAGPDLELCLNDPNEVLAIGGNWTGINVTPEGVFSPIEVGVFDLTFTIGTGTCETSDEMEITVFDLPTVDAGVDAWICEEDSVQLNAEALSPNGSITSYDWIGAGLNDNEISDPWASPLTSTNFSITVTDVEGCQAIDDVLVNVNALPIVDAGPDLTLCDQPIPELLEGFSPLPDMNSNGEWTGIGISDPAGEFTSPGVGTYVLYYTFTDIAGCINLDSIEVEVVSPIVADAGPDQEICLNNGAYQLQGFSPLNNVTWSGDGITDPDLGIFDPLLTGDGAFNLTIEFGSGTCYTSDEMLLTVLPLPVLMASDTTFCDNVGVSDLPGFSPFGGTWEGTGVVDAATGSFDPSIPAVANTPIIYFYTDPNTGCADTIDVIVTVSDAPIADFNVAPLGCTNASVDLTNNSTIADSYEWSWGNGNVDLGFEPIYTYPDEGFFDVQLIASNLSGCSDTLVITNEIIDPPTAALTLLPAEGCAPLEVNFENNTVGQYIDFAWDLAVTTSTDTIPTAVIYEQDDDVLEYEVSLTANNFCGSDMAVDIVTVFPQPVAGFGTDYDEFCTPWDAQINNTSVGNPDTYLWDFGDGTSSTLEEPGSHVFYTDTIPTDYTITLITTNECGVDTFAYTITVLPNTVTAFFNTDITSGCGPLTVEFTDFSEGGTVIAYDFGDENLSNDPNPIHTYTEAGVYTIYQYVNNGCSFDTTSAMVEVFPSPDLDFTTDVPNVCENQAVQFINLSEDINNVEWDFGDGSTSDITNPFHEFESGETFIVTMTATSQFNECVASIQQPFTVYAAPETSFSVEEQVGCSPFTVDFNNTTGNGNFYQWDFGDNETGNGTNVSHTFYNDTSVPVLYTVTLIAENLQLCADTFMFDIIVSPTPVADFDLSAMESCGAPVTISTSNNSIYADGYSWDFSPFGTSDVAEPLITFAQVGAWDVTLVASNAYGCEHALTEVFTVNEPPTANFSVDPSWGCIDLPVSFSSLSTGAVDFQWTFGDGSTGALPNPNHIYTEAGYYDVALIVTSAEGCTDTLNVENQVAAYPVPWANFTFTPEATSIYSPEIEFTDQSLDAFSWFWEFGDGYSSSEENPVHHYELPGSYWIELTVQNIYGCESRDVGQVFIEDEFNVYVPNAFTPDGDNVNDVFLPEIVGEGMVDFYQLTIFDRWGIAVFESNNMNQPWLGDFRQGSEYYIISDVYIWQVKYRLKGAEDSEIMTGHVTVVR